MAQTCPVSIGQSLDDVDSPALIVELDAYERNMDRMVRLLETTSQRLRPHAKTHKSPLIALEQTARGAVGICCQKLAEAKVMIDGGIDNVFISNEVVGARKAEHLATLAKNAQISVCVDDRRNVEQLDSAAQAIGATVTALVEIHVGGKRCGVPPGDAACELAEQVAKSPSLTFGGLQAYHGPAQHIRDFHQRRDAVMMAADHTRKTIEQLSRAGLPCRTITGGGTGTLMHDIEAGVLNELQAGSYVFMDADYALNLDEHGETDRRFEQSLFVTATVMSKLRKGLAVIDAGLKALAFDCGPPLIYGRDHVCYDSASDEHGKLALSDEHAVAYGEKLLLIPGHCDPTVNLYDWYVGVRDGRVERVWEVTARGALG